jgi:hypothetical protein
MWYAIALLLDIETYVPYEKKKNMKEMWPAQIKLHALQYRGKRKRDSCAICMEEYGRMYTLSCNHSFHKDCISEWLCWKRTCPVCRQVVEKNKLNDFRQYGLEQKFGNTPLLSVTYHRDGASGTNAFGSALHTLSVQEPIKSLLKNELTLQDIEIGEMGLAGDIIYQAEQNLSTEDWSHALVGYEHDVRPPFRVIAQELDDGIESETLSIREGALVEWWRRHEEGMI